MLTKLAMLKPPKYSMHAHNAVSVEVKVDPDLMTVHLARVVNAGAAGRILNPKTTRSQVLGSVVWGIGSALMEESAMDHRFGRYMNHDYAEHHILVNADIHDIDVIFVSEEDDKVYPLGIKGLGEVDLLDITPCPTPSTKSPASASAICRWRLTSCCRTAGGQCR